jgi:predicted small secreted protein
MTLVHQAMANVADLEYHYLACIKCLMCHSEVQTIAYIIYICEVIHPLIISSMSLYKCPNYCSGAGTDVQRPQFTGMFLTHTSEPLLKE